MSLLNFSLLPRRIRTMAEMEDLLSAEEQELQLMDKIRKQMEAQLLISTADIDLSRKERIYALPTNPSLSLEERRRRIIAKKNARASATSAFLRDTIEKLTGLKVVLVEFFSEYRIQFKVYLNDKYELDLAAINAQIKELRPAHLLFEVLPIAQVNISLQQLMRLPVAVHKVYNIPVNWTVKCQQEVTLQQMSRLAVRAHKVYEIEVKQ